MKYSIGIAVVGVFLLLVSNLFQKTPGTLQPDEQLEGASSSEEVMSAKSSSKKKSKVTDLESNYQKELERMLEQIKGISEVEVMINLDSTNIEIYEKNLISGQQTTDEADTNGGTRVIEDRTEEKQTVLVRQGDQEVPLLVQTKKPEVRGVFVIAKGAHQVEAKKWIIESTSRVLDVPTHRVSVIPKQ